MTVIKNGEFMENAWVHLTDEPMPASGVVTIPLDRWLKCVHEGTPGVRLTATDTVEKLVAGELNKIPIIVLDMAAFTDGRTFSQARLLERLGYRGEIRARGDFLRDQMFFLSRVGVNAFEFPDGTPLEDRLKAFKEFSVTYQAAADRPEPLYQRR